MADEGLGQVEVSGRWVGFYRYRSEHLGVFPLVAEICQTGDRITGEMYDQITDVSDLLERLVEAFQEDITQGRRRELEKVIEQFGKETVVVTTRPPDTSDLAGRITGSVVQFTKAGGEVSCQGEGTRGLGRPVLPTSPCPNGALAVALGGETGPG